MALGANVVGAASVEVRPDVSGFQRGIARQVNPAVDGVGTRIRSVLGGAFKAAALLGAGTLAGVAIGAIGFQKLTQAGSDLFETQNKVNVVFGDQRGIINDWAQDAATAMGISRKEALDTAGTFGNMFGQLGIGGDQVAGMTTKIGELTADLVSFHNADPTDVITGLTAAFRGEYDSVQRFIPTINAATVQQRALADTHKSSAKELTASDKAMATYALLVEGAGDAEGDWARTHDSLANRQRTLSAQWKDLQATLGTALMPIMEKFVSFLSGSVIPFVTELSDAFGEDGLSGVVRVFSDGLGDAGPKVKEGMSGIFDAIVNWLTESGPKIAAQIPILTDKFIDWVEPYIPIIREKLMIFLRALLQWVGEVAPQVGQALLKLGLKLIEWVAPMIPPLLLELGKLALKLAWWTSVSMPRRFAEWLVGWGLKFWEWVAGVARDIPGKLVAVTLKVLEWAGKLPGKIIKKLGDLAGDFIEVGEKWISKAFDGILDWIGKHGGGLLKAAFNKVSPIDIGGDGWGLGRAGGGHARIPPGGSTIDRLLAYARTTPVQERASSTYRPGAITRSGHQSYHALGRAVDFVGPNLRAIFDSFLPVAAGLKELIYSGAPFSIKNGQRVPRYAVGDHWDHVHVAMAKGGIVTRPTVALMGERGSEMVLPLSGGGGLQVAVYVGNQQITDIVDVRINGVSKEAERALLGGLA